jgi:hypothetical protein
MAMTQPELSQARATAVRDGLGVGIAVGLSGLAAAVAALLLRAPFLVVLITAATVAALLRPLT